MTKKIESTSYRAPSAFQNIEKEKGFAKAGKFFSNIGKQLFFALDLIKVRLLDAEWINNHSILKKLKLGVIEIEEKIKSENYQFTPEDRKAISNTAHDIRATVELLGRFGATKSHDFVGFAQHVMMLSEALQKSQKANEAYESWTKAQLSKPKIAKKRQSPTKPKFLAPSQTKQTTPRVADKEKEKAASRVTKKEKEKAVDTVDPWTKAQLSKPKIAKKRALPQKKKKFVSQNL